MVRLIDHSSYSMHDARFLFSFSRMNSPPTNLHLAADLSVGTDEATEDLVLVETPLPKSLGVSGVVPFDTNITQPIEFRESVNDNNLLSGLAKRIIPEEYLDVNQPPRKRKKAADQAAKRQKYDLLKAFFRVYFVPDDKSAVLKDAIFNLYTRKIAPESLIARNAMYRHMWTFFSSKNISSSQSNYRDYVKGIKLLTEQRSYYEGCEKDIELLRNNGITHLFDFTEEDLAKPEKEANGSDSFTQDDSLDFETEILSQIEQLEGVAQNLLNSIRDIKQKISKKYQ